MIKALRGEIPYPLHLQELYFWVQGTKAVSIYQPNLFILSKENTSSFIKTIMGQVQRTLADKAQQFA